MLTILLKSTIEIALSLLLIYGFIHEKEVIKFEQYVKMVIVVNFRRYKKKKALQKARQQRSLKLVKGKRAVNGAAYSNSFNAA